MAAAGNIFQREEVPPTVIEGNSGHTFYYSFILHNLGDKESWTFRQEFHTECRNRPSSWLCEMVFHKVEDDGIATVALALMRTDSGRGALKVCIEPYILDVEEDFSFDMHPVERQGVTKRTIIEETVVKNLPLAGQRRRFNLKLHARLFIFVSTCHEVREQ